MSPEDPWGSSGRDASDRPRVHARRNASARWHCAPIPGGTRELLAASGIELLRSRESRGGPKVNARRNVPNVDSAGADGGHLQRACSDLEALTLLAMRARATGRGAAAAAAEAALGRCSPIRARGWPARAQGSTPADGSPGACTARLCSTHFSVVQHARQGRRRSGRVSSAERSQASSRLNGAGIVARGGP